ncbi:MAG: sensor histidine kinase, partial [Sedimentibacter sp.]
MTIRRQWLIVLIFIAILTIIVNSVVLGFLMNKYFVGYSIENYQKSFGEIVDYSKNALTDENLTEKQIETQLESYLDDPIIRIKLYDSNGIIIADVANNSNLDNKMMRSKMMDNMMGKPSEEVDSEDIFDDSGKTLGKLNIIKYSSVENSMSTRMYNIALFSNSFLSLRILLIFVVIIGLIISRKMSKDLTNITTLALGIELGNEINIKPSNVREIRTIQNSLETLNSRLKLKQK